MITHSDDGPDFEPDDPLAVILRPTSDYLGPPPGRYEVIRRGAARRRLLRAAAGVGLSCAVAAVIALPLRLATHESPASPTVPLAPPPATSPSAPPSPSASPEPVHTRPTQGTRTVSPTPNSSATRTSAAVPTPAPTATPTQTSASVDPSAVRSGADATPSRGSSATAAEAGS